MTTITLNINKQDYTLDVKADALLIDVLREDLKLFGTKKGCGTGECGACSILIDGLCVNACLVFAVRAQGAKIQTIEGVAENGKLTRLQEIFCENAAVQCGFCGPGMILSAQALLAENPKPTEAEIREGIAGNVCRCSGYTNIVKAITLASQEL
ncbi:MAG: (2Fe-2S)-binding protein [Oscillospiraceae bacterium]|nr:(2Fe-2S)-binding protein [Oscillospiraceae bacterium]